MSSHNNNNNNNNQTEENGEKVTYTAETYVVMNRVMNEGWEHDGKSHVLERWGEVLKWMDLCAGISSAKHAHSLTVTAQVDDVQILNPINKGDMLTVRGKVNCSWNTSMEVEVILEAENLLEKNESIAVRRICTAYFTFVLTKHENAPKKLPKLIPSTHDDAQSYQEAIERRKIRIQKKELIGHTSKDFAIPHHHYLSGDDDDDDGDGDERKGDAKTMIVDRKPISASIVTTCIVVLPPDANHHGNTFGGQIMEWMEEIARLASYKHARQRMYLRALDEIQFFKPSTVGDCLSLKAQVNRVFGNTLEVGVRVENIQLEAERSALHINSGYFTYSSIPPTSTSSSSSSSEFSDQRNELLPIVYPTTEKQCDQFNAALGRRILRYVRKAVRSCSVKAVTPIWSPLLSSELIYSNLQCAIQVKFLNEKNGWWTVKQKDEVIFSMCDMKEEDKGTLCKLQMRLHYKPGRPSIIQLFNVILQPQLRVLWDPLYSSRIVQSVDRYNDIVHSTFSSYSTQEVVDFSLLRTWGTPDATYDGGDDGLGVQSQNYFIVYRSVLHDEIGETNNAKRGFVLPSCFLISKLPSSVEKNDDDDGDGGGEYDINVVYFVQIGESVLHFSIDNIIHSDLFVRLKKWFEDCSLDDLEKIPKTILTSP